MRTSFFLTSLVAFFFLGGVASGAQVNEFFLCTPTSVTKVSDENSSKINCPSENENCQSSRYEKNNLKQKGGLYVTSHETKRTGYTISTYFELSRATGEFLLLIDLFPPSGLPWQIKKIGKCTLEKEELKF